MKVTIDLEKILSLLYKEGDGDFSISFRKVDFIVPGKNYIEIRAKFCGDDSRIRNYLIDEVDFDRIDQAVKRDFLEGIINFCVNDVCEYFERGDQNDITRM